MSSPISSTLAARASTSPDDRALVHHDDPVGEGEELVEVLADEQHCDAVRRGVAQVSVDGLDRADVEPARRRRDDERLRSARELPREHDLLQVAAREEPGGRVRPGAADVVAADELRRPRGDPAEEEKRPPGDLPAVRLEHDVRGDAEARRDAGPEAVLRHVRDTGPDRGPRIAVAQPFPVDLDDARARRPQAGQHLGELALPVARDARRRRAPRRPVRRRRRPAARRRRGRRARKAPAPREPPRRSRPARVAARARRPARPSATRARSASRRMSGRLRSTARRAGRSRGRRPPSPRGACA